MNRRRTLLDLKRLRAPSYEGNDLRKKKNINETLVVGEGRFHFGRKMILGYTLVVSFERDGSSRYWVRIESDLFG